MNTPANAQPAFEIASAGAPRQLVPFEDIPAQRAQQLREEARLYIFASGDARQSSDVPVIDYNEFAGIVRHIAARQDLNDLEKAYVWSTIADAKGTPEDWRSRFKDGIYGISLTGCAADVRDSHPTRDWNTPNHTIVSFRDGYHGFGDPGRSLAYLDQATASRHIREHEQGGPFGIGANPGDAHASQATVSAFHAYRDAQWGHKFEAFAAVWVRTIHDPAQPITDMSGRVEQLRERVRLHGELPADAAPPRLDRPDHPDHGLYAQALAGVSKLEAAPLGLASGQPEQLAAALAVAAKADGLARIDHVVSAPEAGRVFAVAGDPGSPAHQRTHVDADARLTPIQDSSARLAAIEPRVAVAAAEPQPLQEQAARAPRQA